MKILEKERFPEVMKYLESDLGNCLYMYGDLEVYGLDDPHITVWYSENADGINCVIMRYFKGLHVFSKDFNYDREDVIATIEEADVDRISAPGSIIRDIYSHFEKDFEADYGRTLKLSKYRRFKPDVEIEVATEDDVDDIAALLMQHDLYSNSYTYDQIHEELQDRISRGIGRSFIIRDGERVVGHSSYNLETSKYAVEGLTLVHDDFRNTFYGVFLESHLINCAVDEGKDMYGMVFEERRADGFLRMGNVDIGEYGKMNRREIG